MSRKTEGEQVAAFARLALACIAASLAFAFVAGLLIGWVGSTGHVS